MRIEFKKVVYKNIMSVGNAPIEIILNSYKKNLIIGPNGASKSTIIETISFVLFNKPYRNINKNQLVNSVNGKNLLVEIYFSVGTIEYRVVRGIKPNIFEIYQDGVLLNKDSDVRDYQKVLEQQILKLNYKSFTQVEVLGSASFTPFMQLTPAQRRDIIADVLDTGVYSIMGSLNKEKLSGFKDELREVESNLSNIVSAIEAQNKIIKSLQESKENLKNDIVNKINRSKLELETLTDNLVKASEEVVELQNKIISSGKISDLIDECKKRIYSREVSQSNMETQLEFFNQQSECPSCRQNIPHEHKDKVLSNLTLDIQKIQKESGILETKLSELKNKQKEIETIQKEIQTKNISIGSINGSIKSTKSSIISLNEELNVNSDKTDDVDGEMFKLSKLVENGKILNKRKIELAEQIKYAEISSLILKDTGIKSTIIREYLPIINSTINKYLEKMDFYVNFQLDENFNETIKSRYRDDFSYASFSEGEKQMLDISILLAWRYIAKMKNSINTNILFMDETLNGNLDANAVELLMSILEEISEESNIFLITHNVDAFINRFDRVIKFEKQGNFSTKKEF